MTTQPKLVDVAELQTLMAGISLDDAKQNEYINARWLKYVEWWDWRSRQAKMQYQWLRGAVVVGGALIPALVGLRELQQFSEYAWIFSVTSIVASLERKRCQEPFM